MGDAGRPRLDEATRAALLGQFAVEQLLLGLALVEGFMLDVVVVPTARVALSVRQLLEEELPERRADALEIRVLAPDPGRALAFAPVEAEELLERVLAPLMAPPAAKPGVLTLTWIDAATARPEDEPAWTTLFHRFNERRNAITEGLRGPLLVVLPPRMEAVFAHAAPDAWSVRSGVHRVKLADLETHAIDVDPERRPSFVEGAPRGTRRHLNLTLAMESEEPARFDDTTRSWAFSESVSQLLARGALDEAEEVALAALQRARAGREHARESEEATRGLARALDGATRVAAALGDEAETGRLAQEWVQVAREMIRLHGPSLYWSQALASGLAKAAEVTVTDSASGMAHEAVRVARDMHAQHPNNEALRASLLTALTTQALVALRRDALEEAESATNEAVGLVGDSNAWLDGGRSEIPSALVSAFGLRSDVRRRSAHFTGARADAHEALRLADATLERAPHQLLPMRQKARAARSLAAIYVATGDLARAEAAQAVGREVTREMVHRWPQSGSSIALRIASLQESAEVALEARDTRHLASWLDELDRLREAIARRNPADPALESLASSIASLRARWKVLEASTAPPTS